MADISEDGNWLYEWSLKWGHCNACGGESGTECCEDGRCPTAVAVMGAIEAAEKRGAQRALTEAADALDTIRHDHTKATLARSAAGGVAPWLRRRAEEVGP